MMDVTKTASERREELDELLKERRRAEDAAARKHGIDINRFFGQLDSRVYHDPEVEAIQRKIDDIYGRHIDARTQYDPTNSPGLVSAAIGAAGSQQELAARLGVSPRYLRMLAKGEKTMSYPLQVALESICAEKSQGA